MTSRAKQTDSYYAEYQLEQEKIVLEYIAAYLDVAKAKENYLLSQEKLENYRNLYQKELIKYDSGLSSLSFVSNIKGKFRVTQMELLEKQRVVEDKLAKLNQYINVSNISDFYYPNFISKVVNDENEALDIQQKSSFSIKKYKIEEEISKNQYRRNYKTLLPSINLVAKKSWENNFYESGTIRTFTYLTAYASINLFNGGEDWNSYVAGLKDYEQKIESTNKNLLDERLKLKLILNEIKLENSKFNILKHFIKARYDALIGTEYDFKFGKIDISIYLNSISEFFGSREQFITHKYNQLLLKFKFFEAIGKLNDIIKDEKAILHEEIRLSDQFIFADEPFTEPTNIKKNEETKVVYTNYIVNASSLVIRDKPSSDGKVVGVYEDMSEVYGISESNGWIKTADGWVSKKFLVKINKKLD